VVSEGTCFSLAGDWPVAFRPPRAADTDPVGGLPPMTSWISRCCASRTSPATVRLDRPIGYQGTPRPAGGFDRSGQRPRPAIPCPSCSTPDSASLKIAFGQSAGLNGNATRLRYTVNTVGGSSGSPCLNSQLELVGLHHAGDPNFNAGHQPKYNAAIPIGAITDYLAAQKSGIELFPRPARPAP